MVPTRTMPLTSMSYSQITAIRQRKNEDSPNTLSTTTGPAGLRRVEERGAAAATGLGIAYLPAGMPSTGIAAEPLVGLYGRCPACGTGCETYGTDCETGCETYGGIVADGCIEGFGARLFGLFGPFGLFGGAVD